MVDTSISECVYTIKHTELSNNKKLFMFANNFKDTERVRAAGHFNWMLYKSIKSKACIPRECNVLNLCLRINAMQFSLLKQLAVHMVSLLEVGLTRLTSKIY